MIIKGISEDAESAIKEIAKRHNINKVMVFGPRARGDFVRVSDIDLAVSGGNCAAFAFDIYEEVPTLLEFDVVNLDGTVQSELLDSIKKDGITVYEIDNNWQ